MLTPERIIDAIKFRSEATTEKLLVFWCQVLTNRDDMCKRINGLKGDLDLTPIVLRDGGFDNPNALLSDLSRLIRSQRSQFERGPRWHVTEPSPIILLLLSHTEFSLPQISSLATLPSWFPRFGGQSVFILIEDLTRTADGPLSSREAKLDDLCERIFSLEVALTKRLSESVSVDKHCGQSLFSFIKDRGNAGQSYADFLMEAQKFQSEVRYPKGFRPSLKESRSLVSRLLYLVRTSTPDELRKRAKALTIALALPDESFPSDSLLAVLFRGTSKDTPAIRFSRSLLVTMYAAAQFITAAAHSDEYSRYPIILLRSVSFDLRSVLDTSIQTLSTLDIPKSVSIMPPNEY